MTGGQRENRVDEVAEVETVKEQQEQQHAHDRVKHPPEQPAAKRGEPRNENEPAKAAVRHTSQHEADG